MLYMHNIRREMKMHRSNLIIAGSNYMLHNSFIEIFQTYME